MIRKWAPALLCIVCSGLPLRAGAAYHDVVLSTPGLQSYWRLEDSGATAADSKGSNPGTFTNGPGLGVPGALSRPGARAVSFDGLDDFVLLDASQLGTPASISVELWIRINETKLDPGFHTAFTVAADDINDGITINVTPSDRARAIFTSSATDRVVMTSTTTLALGTWYHLVATFDDDSDEARLYVNGVLDISAPWTGNISYAPEREFRLGGQVKLFNQEERFLRGALDEVAVYSRALSSSEVALHRAVGVDDTPPQTSIDSAPAAGSATSSPVFTFSANESGAKFECRIDGSAFTACSSPKGYSAVTEGSHVFEVRATDLAGNVDATAAAAAFVSPAAETPAPVDAGTVEDAGTVLPGETDAGHDPNVDPTPEPGGENPTAEKTFREVDFGPGCGCGPPSAGPMLLGLLLVLLGRRRPAQPRVLPRSSGPVSE